MDVLITYTLATEINVIAAMPTSWFPCTRRTIPKVSPFFHFNLPFKRVHTYLIWPWMLMLFKCSWELPKRTVGRPSKRGFWHPEASVMLSPPVTGCWAITDRRNTILKAYNNLQGLTFRKDLHLSKVVVKRRHLSTGKPRRMLKMCGGHL